MLENVGTQFLLYVIKTSSEVVQTTHSINFLFHSVQLDDTVWLQFI